MAVGGGEIRLADLAVLDRDSFTLPDAEIKKIRSAWMIVNGTIVHETGLLDRGQAAVRN